MKEKVCRDCPEKGLQPISLFHQRIYYRADTKSQGPYISYDGRCDPCRKAYQRSKSRKQREKLKNDRDKYNKARRYQEPNQDLSTAHKQWLYGYADD